MKALFVAWQDPANRQWAPVGRLTKEGGAYKFVYTQGAQEMLPSFQPFGRMTDLRSAYVSEELFPLFANRVLPRSRPEHKEYMHWLGLRDGSYDVMDELSRTGGLRATDTLELFPCPEPTSRNEYEAFFFSRGLSHMHLENQMRAQDLKPGERLFLMQDVQNPYDPMALLMRTGDPVSLVGYAPKYFSAEFTELVKKVGADMVEVTVEQVNKEAPIQYRVLCKLKAPWPPSFDPCARGPFKPLV